MTRDSLVGLDAWITREPEDYYDHDRDCDCSDCRVPQCDLCGAELNDPWEKGRPETLCLECWQSL